MFPRVKVLCFSRPGENSKHVMLLIKVDAHQFSLDAPLSSSRLEMCPNIKCSGLFRHTQLSWIECFLLNTSYLLVHVFPVQDSMDELDPEEQFLRHARNGDLPGIQRLLMSTIKEETWININCKGTHDYQLGNKQNQNQMRVGVNLRTCKH